MPFKEGRRNRSSTKSRSNSYESRKNHSYKRSDNSHHRNEKYRKEFVPVKKDFVNLRLTGLLAEETNMYKGVKIVYNEPSEAAISTEKWRLYQFKGEESLPTIHLHRQSAYLIGKHRGICEIPMDHPSISKQHAVIQFRRIDDNVNASIIPYLIDLKSTNGSFINGIMVEPQKYYELREQDVLKFGFSTREYVLLTDKSLASDDEDS